MKTKLLLLSLLTAFCIDLPLTANSGSAYIKILSPIANVTIEGTIKLSIQTSGVALMRLDIYQPDGLLYYTDQYQSPVSPFLLSWNTDPMNEGDYRLVATGYDSAGNETYDAISVNIKKQRPAPAEELKLTPLAGGQVRLSWEKSESADSAINSGWKNSPQLIEPVYKIYISENEPNFTSPTASVPINSTQWTATDLKEGVAYFFAVRMMDSRGLEDENFNVISVTPRNSPRCEDMFVISPQNGQKISGNQIPLRTQSACGKNGPSSSMRYQYSVVTDNNNGPWNDIYSSVQWDLTQLASGRYRLRALFVDSRGETLPPSGFITVQVDHENPDALVRSKGNNTLEAVQKVKKSKNNRIIVSNRTLDSSAEIQIPAGALSKEETTVTVDLVTQTGSAYKNANLSHTGVSLEVTLGSRQHNLNNNASMLIPYPDNDSDGIVDGTNINEKDVRVYYYNTGSGLWEVMANSKVDAQANTVSVETSHFSLFGLFAAKTGADAFAGSFQLNEAYAYPNPAVQEPKVYLHLDVGQADSIDIVIYTMSGEVLQTDTITQPIAVDGKSIFRYGFNLSGVPSGVYFYAATAHKSGASDIRVRNRFAVIR